MQQFSDRLKQAMEEHGYKQVDLIRLVNETGSPRGIHVGKSHISQYCSGKTTPRADILHVLAQVLEVSPAWLSGEDAPGAGATGGAKQTSKTQPANSKTKTKGKTNKTCQK